MAAVGVAAAIGVSAVGYADDLVSADEAVSSQRFLVRVEQFDVAKKAMKAGHLKISHEFKKYAAFAVELTDDQATFLRAAPGFSSVEPTTLNDHDIETLLATFTGGEFAADTTTAPTTLRQVRGSIRNDGDGKGIDVALIDTGVAPVAGLNTASSIAVGPDLSFDFQQDAPVGVDAYGHGTHLAGIIASRRGGDNEGVAKNSRIVNMKVGAADGGVDVSQVIAAIDWVTTHRNDPGVNIRVMNLSFGTTAMQQADIDPLSFAVESAWRNGIVVVVAAGNSGGALTNPAINPYVLTVGAVDVHGTDTIADDTVPEFSSVGDLRRGVDVVAPGVSIQSLRSPGSYVDEAFPDSRVGTEYLRGSGTSQSAAVVSAAVANLLAKRPALSPDQVKGLLMATARKLPLAAVSAQGAGMIDVKAAISSKLPPAAFAQAWPAGTGTGSLELARGDSHVTSPDGIDLVGEQDIMGTPWVPGVWAPLSANGTAWTGDTWNGNQWTDTGWTVGSPDGKWTGSTWRSRSWRSTTWTGNSWRGRSWRGRSWRSAEAPTETVPADTSTTMAVSAS